MRVYHLYVSCSLEIADFSNIHVKDLFSASQLLPGVLTSQSDVWDSGSQT